MKAVPYKVFVRMFHAQGFIGVRDIVAPQAEMVRYHPVVAMFFVQWMKASMRGHTAVRK